MHLIFGDTVELVSNLGYLFDPWPILVGREQLTVTASKQHTAGCRRRRRRLYSTVLYRMLRRGVQYTVLYCTHQLWCGSYFTLYCTLLDHLDTVYSTVIQIKVAKYVLYCLQYFTVIYSMFSFFLQFFASFLWSAWP